MVKSLSASTGDIREAGSIPGLGKSPGRGHGRIPYLEFLPAEFHGQRILEGFSPWGCEELDMTKAT